MNSFSAGRQAAFKNPSMTPWFVVVLRVVFSASLCFVVDQLMIVFSLTRAVTLALAVIELLVLSWVVTAMLTDDIFSPLRDPNQDRA